MEDKTRQIDLETVDEWRREFAARRDHRRSLAGQGNRKARRAAKARERKES